MLAGNAAQFRGSSNDTYTGDGGTIYVTQGAGSTIKTSGSGSIGIVAPSSGNSMALNDITINLNGAVIGGTNAGVTQGVGAAGILVSGGGAAANPNSVNVSSTGSVGTMDGTGGTAILANSGSTNVTNSGAITGSINLGATPGSITNNTGGVLNPGATLVASTLTNNGTIKLPGFQVNLTGNFVQGGSGNLAFTYNTPATLAVSGSANLGGTITPTVGTSLLPGTQTLLTASSLTVGASVTHPLVFEWNLQTPSNTVTLTPVSNFTPAWVQLSADATSIAGYLTNAWKNADPTFGGVFATLYNDVPSGATYASLLDQLSPRATQVPLTALTNLSGQVLGSAMSCPQFEDGTTLPGVASGSLQSNSEALLFGGRLRAAYDIGFAGWYLRPVADLDLFYTHTPAFTKSGTSPYALSVGASSKANVAITPAIEVGSRFDLNRATTLRAYADIGMSLMPDNQRAISASFAGAAIDDGTSRPRSSRPT